MTAQASTDASRLAEPLARALGDRTATALGRLSLTTVGDLVRHYPRRYGRPGELTDMSALAVGEYVTVMAEVRTVTVRPLRARGGAMLEAVVTDGNATLRLTFFAKRAGVLRMHEDKLRPGRVGLFTGAVGEYRGERQLTHPDYVLVGLDAEDADAAIEAASRPIPIYPAAAGIPTWRIAQAVRAVLDPLTYADVPDPIPIELRQRDGLPCLLDAWRDIHMPADESGYTRAQERLRYEEALVLQAAMARRKAANDALTATARPPREDGLRAALDERLPFTLTAGQVEVGAQIAGDLASTSPMLRLLQGDVGAGKTMVALRAMLQVIDAGGQTALLAPTEVLAAQHERSLRHLLGSLADAGTLGSPEAATRVALLTGSLSAPRRRRALADAASGAAGIVVGTHALLAEHVQFADLGLVVVDEQHRFGVEQRDVLRARARHTPHTLVMSATPIPRTIAMTVFGDLTTSVLADRPPGRAGTATHVVPAANAVWRDRVWTRIREEVDQGRRAYVVCARIEPNLDDDVDDDVPPVDAGEAGRPALLAVSDIALEASRRLPGVGVGVMHGRLSADEKEAAMSRFEDGTTPVLVSTTVVEVGVDVSSASTMVVFDADHFGISQLHQLRGRVGRADVPGLCLLVSHALDGSAAHARLSALASTDDGFVLAERDLELRREGDVLGAAQSGGRNSLRLLRVVRDARVIEMARDDARALVANDPDLGEHPALAAAIAAWLEPATEEFLERA